MADGDHLLNSALLAGTVECLSVCLCVCLSVCGSSEETPMMDLPGQGDPAHDAPGESDTCNLILYRAWQPALEAMQSGREGRDQRDRMGRPGMYVCMYVSI
jgi:hypothetical protein